jgi:flagellar P-ring protein precursor FlgI
MVSRRGWSLVLLLGAACAAQELPVPAPGTTVQKTVSRIRIKDLADVQGVRENQLVGTGLVVGLDGSGDSSKSVASQELANLVRRFGINFIGTDIKNKNVAAVMVTAQLKPFARKGSQVDVQVSSMGDAKSLQGGVLIQTPMIGADGRVYAVAQGALSIGGFSAGSTGGGGALVQKNHTLVGRIPNGGLIEREVPSDYAADGILRMRLRQPDFTTARRITEAINARWQGVASAPDLGTVFLALPEESRKAGGLVEFVSEMEHLTVTPDVTARVVINERTGTIVAGADVRLAPTAISHGGLFITIKNAPLVSQPEAFSSGRTVTQDDQTTTVTEQEAHVVVLEPQGPTLGDLARALNTLKVTPRDIIAIFQAIKDAGALHAELIIM